MAAPRKAAARSSARRPARPKLKAVPEPQPIDILADFGTDEKPPLPIKLGTVEADVLRGFSGEQVVKFHQLVGEMKFDEMLDLITTDGAGLWEIIGGLTPAYASKALNRIIKLSEIYAGELIAPLPGFGMDPAGAQPSPESTATTD
ncbi:hypothetical protein NDR87_30960 [Nocardia sp. CDC159]|uniref:Tail assembly chaperone n=1 Tax=Nocardia pulmonis TaxID=2951408 RepID=A0A9X2J0N6_9NOCA|nr:MULTISPECIES: hypothetical protein [Nocardia]MCM6778029.1 hypothetical protein [Nocardia pulmonis]MCM6790800.1 hypothetical protein [Nocardia sp. CDC159]